MTHAHEIHGPDYPLPPRSMDLEVARAWAELIRILKLKDAQTLIGVAGNGQYTIDGTIPVSVTLDMANITVTATTEALVKLLEDLAKGGILKITHI